MVHRVMAVAVPLLAVVQSMSGAVGSASGAKASEMTRASDTEKVGVVCGSTDQV